MYCINWILLHLIKSIDGQRTSGGIFHLLTGKRSAQTIQDASLFKCTPFVACLKELNRGEYTTAIKELAKQGWISFQSEDVILLSEAGERALLQHTSIYHLPEGYNGAKYEWNGSALVLWQRLSLMIQTLSYLIRDENSFIPVCYQLDIQRWVKFYFIDHGQSYKTISEKLYYELEHFLNMLPEREGKLFVQRLTSSHRTGKTFEQLADNYNQDKLFTKMYFQSILHRYFETVKEKKHDFPVLHAFTQGINEEQFVTVSAKETNRWLKAGKNIAQISQKRGLKISTIEDHLIELALYEPNFNYATFISDEEIQTILLTAKQLQTKKLRLIKDQLPEFNYFQIRLALTKVRNEEPNVQFNGVFKN